MYPLDDLTGIIGRVGSLSQLGSLTLIALLSAAVYYSRRPVAYFGRWALGWVIFIVAVSAIAVRYSLLASPFGTPFGQLGEEAIETRALYFIYMCAKLGFLAMLFEGTRMFARPAAPPIRVGLLLAFSLVAGSAIVSFAPTLNRAMALQSLLAVPVLAGCAALTFTIPRADRSLGSIALASAFLAHTALWSAYGAAFSFEGSPALAPALRAVTAYNSFLDAVLQTFLAYGMVLVVMEQTTRESVAAHAELARAHQALRRSAYHDALSGAYNRYAFGEGMGLEQAGGQPGTVAVLDIDHLKPINDSLGHDAGDALIHRVAQAVESALTPRDAFYRWGGDEFLVVLTACDAPTARQRLTDALAAACALHVAGVVVPVRASFGCAEFANLEAIPAAISRADRGMYEAKSARRVSRDTPVELRAYQG